MWAFYVGVYQLKSLIHLYASLVRSIWRGLSVSKSLLRWQCWRADLVDCIKVFLCDIIVHIFSVERLKDAVLVIYRLIKSTRNHCLLFRAVTVFAIRTFLHCVSTVSAIEAVIYCIT